MSNFTREPVVALLASPHFSFRWMAGELRRRRRGIESHCSAKKGISEAPIGCGNSARTRGRSGGGRTPRTSCALLPKRRTAISSAGALSAFLEAHDRIPPAGDQPARASSSRARRAILSAIHGLRRAHQRLDDSPVDCPGSRRDDPPVDRRADVYAARRNKRRSAPGRPGRAVRRI